MGMRVRRHQSSKASLLLAEDRPGVTAEEELTILLSSTQERRDRQRHRIEELADRVDFDSLSTLLGRQNVIFVAYARLAEIAPNSIPTPLREKLDRAAPLTARRGRVAETLALKLQADLEQAGIPAIPLKGPLLSRKLYGDPGMRVMVDLDFLVQADQLDLAVRTIEALGYSIQPDLDQRDGVPLFHQALTHDEDRLLPVELHWRVHWYETNFSHEMLAQSTETSDGRRARPEDELASLLLVYARDSFLGLRLAGDIATWWDQYGREMETPLLDGTAARHPEIREALTATSWLLEGLVGIPAGALISKPEAPSWRMRTAVQLANWNVIGEPDQVTANATFVDWLLAAPDGWRDFVGRALLPPRARLVRMYGLPPQARWRRYWWRGVHGPKLMLRYLLALWHIRGGRTWVQMPESVL